MKKRSTIIVVIVLLTAAISAIVMLIQVTTIHGPILIESNQDFEEQGWPGSGTPESPYAISGLRITSGYIEVVDNVEYAHSAEAAIIIRNTDVHFVVSNCLIMGAAGILLENVANGTIEFCTNGDPNTTGVSEYSVFGCNVSNCTIENNSFGNCMSSVIHLENGSSNTVSGNTIFYTNPNSPADDVGIDLVQQTLVNCRTNTISGCTGGIRLIDCSGGRYFHWVSNNIIDDCGTGILVSASSHLPILQNQLNNNTRGYRVLHSIAVNFSSNTVSHSSDGGIWVQSDCIDCIVSYNDVESNEWAGIIFSDMINTTHPCLALKNNIKNNDGWGIIINGRNNVILSDNVFTGNTLGSIGYNISHPPPLPLAACDLQLRFTQQNSQTWLECMVLIEERN